MKKAAISFLTIWTMIFANLLGTFVFIPEDISVSAITITVDDNGPADYTNIQDAINAANDGDTVFVYNGTYYDKVVVNRTINLVGEDRNSTKIRVSSDDDVIDVTSDWVNITGFTVRGSYDLFKSAIKLNVVDNCRIFNNNISNAWHGIYLHHSSKNNITGNNLSENSNGITIYGWAEWNIVTNNIAYSNYYTGIILTGAKNNTVAYNIASYNLHSAICLEAAEENNITGNIMIENGINIRSFTNSPEHWNSHNIDTSNILNGKPVFYWKNKTNGTIPSGAGQVILANCTNVTIENQELDKGSVGIGLGFSSNNYIINNNISHNKAFGIRLYYSNNNRIIGNNITDNNHIHYYYQPTTGIWLYYSNENNVIRNKIINSDWGIYSYSSYNNDFSDLTIDLSEEYGYISSGASRDNILINSTILNSASDDIYFWGHSILTVINSSFDKTKVSFFYSDSLLKVKWFMNVYVESVNGLPIPEANIYVTNITDDQVQASPFKTGNDGFARWIAVTDYFQNDTNGNDPGGDNKVYHRVFNVTATRNESTGYAKPEPVMDSSKVVPIILDIEKPIADAGIDSSVDEDEPYVFNGSSSFDNTGIGEWTWDFGDGIFGYGETPTHTYTFSGFYVVALNVTDTAGNWDIDTVTIFVNNVSPTADAGSDKFGDEGEQISFDGSNSIDTASDIDSLIYTWDFGDGTIGMGKMVNHSYEDNGTYTVTLQVADDDGTLSIDSITITINNTAPEITPISPQFLQEDQIYTLQVIATDVKGDILTFSDNTTMFDIDSATGVISFTPSNTDVGMHLINVTVVDDDGAESYIEIQMIVQNTNDAPIITSSPITIAIENSTYYYNLTVVDDDLDTIAYELDMKPDGMTIDSNGRITWIPTYQQASQTFMVIVNVSDGNDFDTQTFSITVMNVNDEPTTTSTPVFTATEDVLYTYDVDAVDVDIGDRLIYSLDTAPIGMSIDSSTGLITWVPTNDQVGDNDVVVNVTDSMGAFITQEFTIAVANSNDAPILEAIGPLEATEGETFSYIVTAIDIDAGDTLIFSDDTDLFDINSITGNITFIPSNDDVGRYIVRITVTDSNAVFDFENVIFTINNVNNLPSLTIIESQTLTEDVPFTLIVTATDIDIGDTQIFLDNATLFDINPYTGEISFNPTNEDVGTYFVNITVKDKSGSIAYQAVIFTVNNVNDPPLIESMGGLTVVVGKAFSYTVMATDVDNGNTLIFSDDTVLFNIDPDTSEISFTPTEKDAGVHYVTITVTDEEGETDQTVVTFTILEAKGEAPINYTWILLIIIVGLIAFFIGYFIRERGKIELPEEKEEGLEPEEIEMELLEEEPLKDEKEGGLDKEIPQPLSEEEETVEFEAIDEEGLGSEKESRNFEEEDGSKKDENVESETEDEALEDKNTSSGKDSKELEE